MADQTDKEKQATIIWQKVEELREKRRKAFEAHDKFIKEFPPKFDCDRGCAEAAGIANQIEQVIATGKLLGLIEARINYMDYL